MRTLIGCLLLWISPCCFAVTPTPALQKLIPAGQYEETTLTERCPTGPVWWQSVNGESRMNIGTEFAIQGFGSTAKDPAWKPGQPCQFHTYSITSSTGVRQTVRSICKSDLVYEHRHQIEVSPDKGFTLTISASEGKSFKSLQKSKDLVCKYKALSR